MENSLKQRIVGAIVLIALAVIFLPAILKEKANQQPFESKIPPKPASLLEDKQSPQSKLQNKATQQTLNQLDTAGSLGSVEYAKDERLTKDNIVSSANAGKTKSKKSTQAESTSDESKATVSIASVEVPQTIGEQFKEAAWVIQVASFANRENALSFVEKLQKAGHKAFRRTLKREQGKSVFRVYAGPYIEKQRAEKAVTEINKISGSSGLLLVYDPTKH